MHDVAVAALPLADHVRGVGRPLLLVHGGAGSHHHWDRVLAPLARHFEVHAPDLPGFGTSPDVPPDLDGHAYVALAAARIHTWLSYTKNTKTKASRSLAFLWTPTAAAGWMPLPKMA